MTGSNATRWMIVLGLCWSATPARAQEPIPPSDANPTQTIARPVELLIGFDDLTSWQGRGQDVRLSLSVPASERLAIELFGGRYRGDEKDWDVRSVWGFQFRQRLMRASRPGQETFVTYGVVALFAPQQCNGVSCGYDGSTSFLPLGTLGFGLQQSIGSRLAVRAEVQGGFFVFVPVGVRLAVGVAIPLGGRRVPRITD